MEVSDLKAIVVLFDGDVGQFYMNGGVEGIKCTYCQLADCSIEGKSETTVNCCIEVIVKV